jgi:Na+-driven multidrug efflux pump
MRLKRSPSFKQDVGLQGSYCSHNYSLIQNNSNFDDILHENDDDHVPQSKINHNSTNKNNIQCTAQLLPSDTNNHGDDHNSSSSSSDDDDDSVGESALETTLPEEIRIIVALSGQGIIAQLAWSVESFLVASYIGRKYGSIHLDGYMLAMLSCNLTAYSLMEGIYSAVDTLLPQSYGSKNYSEVQMLVIRCVIISLGTIMPLITILAIYMNQILLFFGEDPVASQYATNWYRIYCLSVPFYILYHTTNSFLSAQYIVLPEVITALISSVFILPILVTSFGTYFGFLGTSVSIVIYQAIQSCMMIGYVIWQQPHHPDTWPRPTNPNNQVDHFKSLLKKAMKWKPFSKLLFLGIGGMVAE